MKCWKNGTGQSKMPKERKHYLFGGVTIKMYEGIPTLDNNL